MVAIRQYRVIRMAMIIVAPTIFLCAFYYNHPTIVTLPSESGLQLSAYLEISDADEIPGALSNKNISGNQQASLPAHILSSSSIKPNELIRSDSASDPSNKSDQHENATSHSLQSTHSASSTSPNTDTSKGIRTGDLYQPGHSEANIELCPDAGEKLRLLILITSAPTNQKARLAIRQTWGHYATRRDIAIAFVLGATQQKSIDESLSAENYMYGDLIRGHFIDSYNNLTLKTISLLEWVGTYCPKASFILKTDDDMFINVPKLLMFIEKHKKDKKVIYGRLTKNWKPWRNKKSKYYVSPQQYFPPVFPQFTTGPAYLMTSDVVHSLYSKALNQIYLKLEDVVMTGIVAELVNVKRVHVNTFLNRRIAFDPCKIRKAISVHKVESNEQYDLWKKLFDTNITCYTKSKAKFSITMT